MPSFSTEVKNELARLTYEDSCCRTAELAALLRMGATITFGMHHTFGLNFTTENAAVARKVLQLLKSEGGSIRTEITVSRNRRLKKNNSYSVRVMPAPPVATLLEHLGFLHDASLNMDSDMGILRKTCCRAAYLRGAFLGGGSVNRPEASYHLELVTGSYGLGNLLYTLMKRMDFPVGFTDRKDSYIVYLKEGDAIIDFLAMLHADKVIIGDIMLLIPGMMLTNSIGDILLGDVISGSIRLIEAVMLAASLALGIMAAIILMQGVIF